MSPADLLISDLRLWVHLGCTAEERHNVQLVRIDVALAFAAPPPAMKSDRLEDTVCSHKTVLRVQETVQGNSFHLIEHLAARVLGAVCGMHGGRGVAEVAVTVHKPSPPIPGLHGGVSFTCRGAPS